MSVCGEVGVSLVPESWYNTNLNMGIGVLCPHDDIIHKIFYWSYYMARSRFDTKFETEIVNRLNSMFHE